MAGNNDSGIQQIQLPNWRENSYGGVTVVMKERMDADHFVHSLPASISFWRQLGKKSVWIKVSPENSHLLRIMLEEGFRYHHSESSHLILVRWLPGTLRPIPANASHGVGVISFVLNDKREVLVVRENSRRFRGNVVWKLPTGGVNEGEDIWRAALRAVREKTGVETKFCKLLGFEQSHRSYYPKSDLFFLCKLQPNSTIIKIQTAEVEAAQWMRIEEYAAQPSVVRNEQLNIMAKICLARADCVSPGFTPLATATRKGSRTYIYCGNPGVPENFPSRM